MAEKIKNAWQKHLMSYKKEHPKLSLVECMKKAKTTYKKKEN